jgi:hypothetical protein
MIALKIAEHAAPDSRANGQVLTAGPFVTAEIHGAVFNGYFYVVAFGLMYQRIPYIKKPLPLIVD